ncbi:hypothetical protein KKB18_01825 [bacterium]|nr:hypothetical protein [bacterium]
MSSLIEEIARNIVALEPKEQEELLSKVATMNYERGLIKLTQKYRERLKLEGKLDQQADEILAELRQIRMGISSDDYSF